MSRAAVWRLTLRALLAPWRFIKRCYEIESYYQELADNESY